MIFKPDNSRLWDTIILPHEGKFYLFYLQLRHEPWDGYGLAVSDDMLHWEDRGTIFATEPGERGMGTGMVWRAGGRWMLNYSLGEQGSQRIYFAESDDLLTWRRLPKDNVCAPDPRWYECTGDATSASARWDTISVVPQDDGTFLGFLTATGKDGPAGANGVAGMVSSQDGVHWKTEPPASLPCGMGWAEVVSYLTLGGRHYLLAGSSSGLGPRFDPVYNTSGKAAGMYVMVSENIRGPYRLAEGDPMLLGCRNAPPNWAYAPTYCTRAFPLGQETLICHQWMPRAEFLDAWLGTVKIVEEATPGKLALKFWPGNEKLKGAKLFDMRQAGAPHTPFPQKLPNVEWHCGPESIRGSTGSSALAYFDFNAPYGDGVVIEVDLRVKGEGAAGLFFGSGEHCPDRPYDGVACLANRRGCYEFGAVCQAPCGPAFMIENHVERDVPDGKPQRWRVLLRGEFVELYVGDALVQCFGFSRNPARNIGVFVERAEVELRGLTVHAFA